MRCSCGSYDVIKNGYFKSPQHGAVQKYLCKSCKSDFSSHSQESITKDHRPELNQEVVELHRKGLSEREIATQLGCSRTTVRRKLEKYL